MNTYALCVRLRAGSKCRIALSTPIEASAYTSAHSAASDHPLAYLWATQRAMCTYLSNSSDSSSSSPDESTTHHLDDDLRPCAEPKPGAQVGERPLYGCPDDAQLRTDLSERAAVRNELSDLDLSRCRRQVRLIAAGHRSSPACA